MEYIDETNYYYLGTNDLGRKAFVLWAQSLVSHYNWIYRMHIYACACSQHRTVARDTATRFNHYRWMCVLIG